MIPLSDIIPSPRFLAEQKTRDAKYEAACAEARYLEFVATLRVQNRAYWQKYFGDDPPVNEVSWFATHQYLEKPAHK